MKQYFLLPLLCLFIIGCSLEIGNEYDGRRLPVDNKSYLLKQKRERKSARQDIDVAEIKKRRYKFKDSERPQRQDISYRTEYMHNQPIIDEEGCEQYCDDNGCESYCHENELVSDNAPEYYPDYDVRGEGIDDDYGMHAKSENAQEERIVSHIPKGRYHEKPQEKSVKIQPYKKHNLEKPQKVQAKKTTSVKNQVINSRKSVHVASQDDEGIPTIPPKISTHDDIKHLAPQPRKSLVQNQNVVEEGQDSDEVDEQPVSTVKEANQNIATIQSQIESRNIKDKAKLNSPLPDNQVNGGAQPAYNDMHGKLSQLQELTSQGQDLQKFTPKLPTGNQPKIEKFGVSQQKTSSQEVHLQLDSNSRNNKPPVGEPSRSDLPPPVDLSE